MKVIDRKESFKELFALEDENRMPIWLQLKNRFIYLITSGYYMPGDHLPTVRGLAADIEINYNTVSKVYKSLEEDGYIQTKTRQGAFVCDVSDMPGVSTAATAKMVTNEYLNRCLELGLSLEAVEHVFAECVDEVRARRGNKQGGAEDEGKEKEEGAGARKLVALPSDNTPARSSGNNAGA